MDPVIFANPHVSIFGGSFLHNKTCFWFLGIWYWTGHTFNRNLSLFLSSQTSLTLGSSAYSPLTVLSHSFCIYLPGKYDKRKYIIGSPRIFWSRFLSKFNNKILPPPSYKSEYNIQGQMFIKIRWTEYVVVFLI